MSRIMGDVYTRVHGFNHPFQHVLVDSLDLNGVKSNKTTKIYPSLSGALTQVVWQVS